MDIRVQRTIDRMEEQLHRQVTMTELAGAVGLSVAQLTRIFRRATGRTPGVFLNDLRLRRARILIERTSLSITEVMAQVGVSDRGRFARAFRLAYGVSPRTLRVQQRHGVPAGAADL